MWRCNQEKYEKLLYASIRETLKYRYRSSSAEDPFWKLYDLPRGKQFFREKIQYDNFVDCPLSMGVANGLDKIVIG
jgi:hypothetical protein